MTIRKAEISDIKEIMDIYEIASKFMIENGNPTQWEKGYPSKDILRNDIDNGDCYVCLENQRIVGVFSLILGEEPTYQDIKKGKWNYDKAYGTIHRLASNGTVNGIAKACFDFCAGKSDYLRIDTHANNVPMQSAIKTYGFKKCCIINVRNGERIAFDYMSNSK